MRQRAASSSSVQRPSPQSGGQSTLQRPALSPGLHTPSPQKQSLAQPSTSSDGAHSPSPQPGSSAVESPPSGARPQPPANRPAPRTSAPQSSAPHALAPAALALDAFMIVPNSDTAAPRARQRCASLARKRRPRRPEKTTPSSRSASAIHTPTNGALPLAVHLR